MSVLVDGNTMTEIPWAVGPAIGVLLFAAGAYIGLALHRRKLRTILTASIKYWRDIRDGPEIPISDQTIAAYYVDAYVSVQRNMNI